MWFLRQLGLLVVRVAVAALIVFILAALIALIRGGDTLHTFKIMCLLFGILMLLLGVAGTNSAASRRVNWGEMTPSGRGIIFRGYRPRPGEPELSATAVFVATGLLLIALGIVS